MVKDPCLRNSATAKTKNKQTKKPPMQTHIFPLFPRLKILFLFVFIIGPVMGQSVETKGLQQTTSPAFYAGKTDKQHISGEVTMEQLLWDRHPQGGLVVHVEYETGKQSGRLVLHENFLVQGLNTNREKVKSALQYSRTVEQDGRLSFKEWDGDVLPYTDNIINVLFWENQPELVDMAEIMRVLAPNGTAYIKGDSDWQKVVKPWPDEIDEWTHYRYDAGNTGMSKDRQVGPPNHVQWEGGPRFMRTHEIESGFAGAVSANGRLYYIIDEGPIGVTDVRFPMQWNLVCRDAFNGMILWKRPMSEWGWQVWEQQWRDNPDRLDDYNKPYRRNVPEEWVWRTRIGDVDRLFVADGDTLFVTLSFGGAITAIDGATGETLHTYEETHGTVEFIVFNDLLIVRTNNPDPAITAIRADDGEVLWRHEDPVILDRSLSAAGEQVFFHNRSEAISLDVRTGEKVWVRTTDLRPGSVIAHDEVVLLVMRPGSLALSAETGEPLWEGPWVQFKARYPDIFVSGDVAWYGVYHHSREVDFHARDIRTGDVLQRLEMKNLLESDHHRRCFMDRGVSNYIVTGRRGSEFVDLSGANDHKRHNWTRGACVSGMMGANGLYYVPPHNCFCYPAVRMDGFFAFNSRLDFPQRGGAASTERRTARGPAFGQISNITDSEADRSTDQWPVYRQNAMRSGSVSSGVPSNLEPLWTMELGGRLTQPVVADGRVYVADKDEGTLHCLDLDSGRLLWSETVTGRIDSPPSVFEGMVIFGSTDGYVYSLRATDGEWAWRFRAAPEDRQIISYERLESPWPVHGSVLIMNDLVYFSAGRSGFLDGGIHVYAIDPVTGVVIYENRLEGPYPDIAEPTPPFNQEGYRSDLLTTGGSYIYMGRTVFDQNLEIVEPEYVHLVGRQGNELEYRIMPGMRLIPTAGFLNDTFWDRTWWMYSHVWPGFYYAQQAPKSGQMLVFDEQHTYTVKHYTTRNRHSPMFFPENGYLLFSDDNDNEPLFYRGEGEPKPIAWEPEVPEFTRWNIYQDAAVDKGPGFTRSKPARWTSWTDVRIESMVLAGDKLFYAGPPDVVPDEDPLASFEGRMGGMLRGVSVHDGSELEEYRLDAKPVFDGLISAQGKLLISLEDGRIICLGTSRH